MAISNFVNNNEEYLKDAINNGVSSESVGATIEDMVVKSEELGKTPSQLKEAVETIADMKSSVENKNDETFASDLVKENSEKIKSALNDGLSPDEVANALIKSTDEATNKKGKKHLNFIVNLISKMKRKEFTLSRNREKGRQKIKVNE